MVSVTQMNNRRVHFFLFLTQKLQTHRNGQEGTAHNLMTRERFSNKGVCEDSPPYRLRCVNEVRIRRRDSPLPEGLGPHSESIVKAVENAPFHRHAPRRKVRDTFDGLVTMSVRNCTYSMF